MIFINDITQISVSSAFKNGNAATKLSLIVLGFGSLVNKQYGRFIAYILIEIAYIIYMIGFGINSLANMITLGTNTQQEIFNESKQIYEYIMGDNSMLCLLYGVITVFVTIGFIIFALSSMKIAYSAQLASKTNTHRSGFIEDVSSLTDKNLHKALLTFPLAGIIMFTIIPLIFMILIAFTNYDRNHQPPGNLFDWVGLVNFQAMFASSGALANTFWSVLSWTIVWAIFATFTNFFLGMLLAITINREKTQLKKFWRFIFVLSIAVPAFVSLLTMRTIFSANGALNIVLRDIGILGVRESINFFGDPLLAKITIIVVNIWIGVPYTMLTTTGILQNIPAELYESAKLDGANPFKTFIYITLPYMMFIMTPALITAFVGNINNFNVIFLLTGGGPNTMEFYYAGHTDLLVTWLYKLTVENKDYSYGSVIGILTFVLVAVISLITYRRTGSYKDEEAFQK